MLNEVKEDEPGYVEPRTLLSRITALQSQVDERLAAAENYRVSLNLNGLVHGLNPPPVLPPVTTKNITPAFLKTRRLPRVTGPRSLLGRIEHLERLFSMTTLQVVARLQKTRRLLELVGSKTAFEGETLQFLWIPDSQATLDHRHRALLGRPKLALLKLLQAEEDCAEQVELQLINTYAVEKIRQLKLQAVWDLENRVVKEEHDWGMEELQWCLDHQAHAGHHEQNEDDLQCYDFYAADGKRPEMAADKVKRGETMDTLLNVFQDWLPVRVLQECWVPKSRASRGKCSDELMQSLVSLEEHFFTRRALVGPFHVRLQTLEVLVLGRANAEERKDEDALMRQAQLRSLYSDLEQKLARLESHVQAVDSWVWID
jgi:hypothetical protein